MAGLLDVPISRVKVVPMEIGGGFGGKLTAYLEPLAALLSKKSGRPVKMTMTRAEVLEASGPTAGSHVTVKIGVTNEGRITAAFGKFLFEGGGVRRRAGRARVRCHLRPIQHRERAHRRVRHRHQQAFDQSVPRAGRADRRFRDRVGGR